ncbi:hypothetical protein [Neorhizobium lilium]|uniref:hypothetical protein n=1 Tax=Neorhizobium lilium TaxID=2503024 RepID=UPI00315D3C01
MAALPDFMGMSDAKLVPARPGIPLMSRDIWLVVHYDLKRSAPVKVVSQRVREIFRTA